MLNRKSKHLSLRVLPLKRNNIKRHTSPIFYKRKSFIEIPLSKSTLIERKLGNNYIKIFYKGNILNINKKEFYNIKKLDINKLKVNINEKKEIIKQKKIYLKNENKLFDIKIINNISKEKEKQYRENIINIQKELRKDKNNININKEEITNYYKNILNMTKNLNKQIDYEINKRINDIGEKLNLSINKCNKIQSELFNKKIEDIEKFFDELKLLIYKMENVIKNYYKNEYNINIYTIKNKNLRQEIKNQNKINENIILYLKLIKMNKNNNNLKYKKININNNKNQNKKKILSQKKIILKSNYNTNNNSMTNIYSNNSYNNIISTSNHCMSTTFMSFNSKNKENKNKEKKIIKNLYKNINNMKNKINIINKKLKEEIPQNGIYDIIKNIMNIELNKKGEDSGSHGAHGTHIINTSNGLIKNLKKFPYENKTFRQNFMNKLFNDKKLYQYLVTKIKNLDIVFNKNLFDINKLNKK